MSQSSSKSVTGDLILRQLRHPLKLRVIVCVSMITVWYVSFFMPLDERTGMTSVTIARERKRIATAKEIEAIKKALAPHDGLIPAEADVNELMRHVIDHLRSSPLKLTDLKPNAPKDLGPYQAIGLQLAIEGQFAEIDAFLGWLEAGKRHLRVDSIRLDPSSEGSSRLKGQLTLVGLADKTPSAAKTKPPSEKTQPTKK